MLRVPHSAARRAVLITAGLLLFVPAALPAEPPPVFDDVSRSSLWDALLWMNMTVGDLGFEKDHGQPRWSLQWVRGALSKPLDVPGRMDAARKAAAGDDGSVWGAAASLMELGDLPPVPVAPAADAGIWEGLDAQLVDALTKFMTRSRGARQLLDGSLSNLAMADRHYIAASWLGGLYDVEDHEEVRNEIKAAGIASGEMEAVVAEARALDPEPGATRFLDALLNVDQASLWSAGREFHAAVAELYQAALNVQNWPEGNIVVVTDLGKVRICGKADESYKDDAFLVLQPGGNSAYSGPAGAANGLLDRPMSAIIDLGGNDHYAGDALLAPGSALFGLCVIIDRDGDDIHGAPYAGQGAAVAGVAWLEDMDGDDVYRARAMAQGAAVLGFGFLRDRAGNDIYDAGFYGQGFAGFAGAGWLMDDSGHDRYLAGGREPDHERHQDRFVSLAQGFATGIRPFAGGGVGILQDLSGNDTYVADVFGQGVSYYYAAGLLMDEDGNDSYRVHHYGQGSGIHMSVGALFDGGGNDAYDGDTLAQGCAHDYGVGLLFERAGNDTYVASAHSQGHGMNNSFAMLLDRAGDDRYHAPQSETAQGVGNTGGHRDYGSLGFLLDVEGNDFYSCGATNGARMLRPLYGIVYDRAGETAPGKEVR